MRDETKQIRAGFGPRAAAFLLDECLLMLALLLVRIPAWAVNLSTGRGGTGILFDHTALDILCYVLMRTYFILLTLFTGGTLGKKVMGLRVENADGTPLRALDVIYRETIGRYLSGVAGLGYLMALVDSRKRAFHDYLCDTCVVYTEQRPIKETAAAVPAGGPVSAGCPAAVPAPVESVYTIPGACMASPPAPVTMPEEETIPPEEPLRTTAVLPADEDAPEQ